MCPDRNPAGDRFDTDHDDELVPVMAGSPNRTGEAPDDDTAEQTFTLLSPEAVERRRRQAPARPLKRTDSPWVRAPGVTDPPSGPEPLPARDRSGMRLLVAASLVAVAVVAFLLGRAGGGEGSAVDAPLAWPRTVDGIPSGFTADEAGAQSAASSFVTLFSDTTLTQPDRLRRLLDAVAAPGADFSRAAGGAASAFAERSAALGLPVDGSLRFRTYPLAVTLAGYAAETAEVEVWSAAVVAADGIRPASAGFVTFRFVLVWSGGDWRLDDVTVRGDPAGPALPPGLDSPPLVYRPAQEAQP